MLTHYLINCKVHSILGALTVLNAIAQVLKEHVNSPNIKTYGYCVGILAY